MSAAVAGPRARRSLFVWGWYMVFLGVMMHVAPNVMLTTFGLPPTQEVWIRVVGMLSFLIAYFSFASSRSGNAEYMRWSVNGRLSVPVFLTSYVLMGWAGPALLPFGVLDLAGALWTRWALARDAAG